MDDLREEVMTWLKICGMGDCSECCPYRNGEVRASTCYEQLMTDALSLLKAQEPKQMIAIAESDANISVGRCPSCDETIVNNSEHPTRFCKYCGQAVKWE